MRIGARWISDDQPVEASGLSAVAVAERTEVKAAVKAVAEAAGKLFIERNSRARGDTDGELLYGS